MRRFALLLPLIAAIGLPAPPSRAADAAKNLGLHGAWSVFSSEEGGQPLCYASAQPAKSSGAPAKRGGVFFLVTDRPADKQLDIVSYNPGLTLKPATTVKLAVGKASFPLFVARNTGWANDGDDAKIVDAMRKGETLTVTVTPAKGEPIVDQFALAQVNDALKALDAACKTGKPAAPDKPAATAASTTAAAKPATKTKR